MSPGRLSPEQLTALAVARQRLRDGETRLDDLNPALLEAARNPGALAFDEPVTRWVCEVFGIDLPGRA
jgi:hypothetical protein